MTAPGVGTRPGPDGVGPVARVDVGPSVDRTAELGTQVDRCIDAAVTRLFAMQRADGSWEGHLPSSAVATAAVVLALHAADRSGSAEMITQGADWLCATQRADGGWGDTPTGGSTLNATALACAALRVVRPAATAAVAAAVAAIERMGGRTALEDLERTTLNTIVRVHLADAGLYPQERVPRIPVEVILLPRWVHRKVSFILPGLLSWGVMQCHQSQQRRQGLLRRAVSRRAEAAALRYLRRLREFEGPDGGAEESAFMVALIVYGLAGAGVGADILAPYVGYLRAAVRPDGSWPVDRDLELSGTCYVAQALQEVGLAGDPRLARTAGWIAGAQRSVPLPATGCPPGGWGWSMPSSWPDTDDTALALQTLAGFGRTAADPTVRRGLEWLGVMGNRNGSWSCFIRNGRVMFDSPCAVLTAHAASALHTLGDTGRRLDRALAWLASAQHPDGAVPAVWFRNFTAGTARTLEAVARLGAPAGPVARPCVRWLLDHETPGGGWGDGCGAAPSVEETSWAVLGLVTAGRADHPAVARAVRWLVDRQDDDGRWPASPIGYYYNGLTYWCDAMAAGYAVQALGRYRAAVAAAPAAPAVDA